MKKWQKEWLIYIVSLIIIFLGAREIYRYIVNKDMKDYYFRCDNSNADTFQIVLGTCLDEYTSNENIIAIADTDEKMKAYKTLDEIIDIGYHLKSRDIKVCWDLPIFERNIGYHLKSRDIKEHDSCLEENIRIRLENYIKSEGKGENGRYIVLKSGEKYQVWVLIQGSYKEGFTVLVEVAKKDPFSKIRSEGKND